MLEATALQSLLDHPVNKALTVAFTKAGVPLYVVGGPVRDALSGSSDFSDLDYTTPALPEEALKIVSKLGPTWNIGMNFGTVCVQVEGMQVEITTHRKEAYEENSRKPVVVFGESITDDLLRRDLTINAMALCLVAGEGFAPGELIDLYNGRVDLTTGVVRTPDDPDKTMSEDPLRMIRAIRFSITRDMSIHPSLFDAIIKHKERLDIISQERFTTEFKKIAKLGPRHALAAVATADYLGVLPKWLQGASTPTSAQVKALKALQGDTLDIFSVLGSNKSLAEATVWFRALKLSSDEVKTIVRTLELMEFAATGPDRLAWQLMVRKTSEGALSRFVRVSESFQADVSTLLEVQNEDAAFVRTPLPVSGSDLLDKGLKGREVGAKLQELTVSFLQSGGLTRAELLEM